MRAPPPTATSAASRRTMAASRGRRPISSARSAVRSPERRAKLGCMPPAPGIDRKIANSEETRRFFGRRKGHRLRAHQAELIETLLPRLALDLRHGAEPLPTLFPVPVGEIRLEIGFGVGEHLIAEAVRPPQTGVIGCEPFVNGMAKALAAIEAQGLRNVRLHLGDAVPVLSWLPPASLVGIDLLYRDPWPKRRH